MINKIAIGTATFGMKYGITNKSLEVSSFEVGQILDLALASQINTIDTAIMYGNAHKKLAQYKKINLFNIISKIPFCNNFIEAEQMCNEALSTLNTSALYGMLLHDSVSIFNDGVYEVLISKKEQGLIKKIGVSVYTPNELIKVIEKYNIDIVQIPFNILNQQFASLLPELKKLGIEVHIRSIFLQGILLEPVNFISQFQNPIQKYINFLANNNIKPIEACYLFLYNYIQYIDKICIGVANLANLAESIKEVNSINYSKSLSFLDLNCKDDNVINPSLWKR